MNKYLVNAEIILHDNAKKWVASWPMVPNFRTSFWLEGDQNSCPCEIQSHGEIGEIGKVYNVVIMLPKIAFLEHRLRPNKKFYFGLRSDPIGDGSIIK